MKLSLITWFITALFVWMVAGNSYEQLVLVAKVAFTGTVLGVFAGFVGLYLEATTRPAYMTMQRRK